MPNPRFDLVHVFVEEVKVSTDKAAMCLIDGDEVWLPWSQIHGDSEIEGPGDSGNVIIPRWLAEEKELEYEED